MANENRKPRLYQLMRCGFSRTPLEITENGTYDVKNRASVIVDVPTSGGGGGGEQDPIGDDRTVSVIKWSAFQTLVENESVTAGQIYSIEL